VEISKMKTWREIFPSCDEIRTTEEPHLKSKIGEEHHSEAIGAGFVSKSSVSEVWSDTRIGLKMAEVQKVELDRMKATEEKVELDRTPIGPESMGDIKAISKATQPDEKEATCEEEEEPEEEIIQMMHQGVIHAVPYSQVRTFRTRFPSATFVTPIHRNPQPIRMILPYMSASTNIARTAGSNTATGRTSDSGENVPWVQEETRSQRHATDSDEHSGTDESGNEWANYWPPSPPSSEDEDEEEETPCESDIERADMDIRATEHAVQLAVEPKGAPMNNTIPETDGIGLKSLKCYHGDAEDVDIRSETQIQESETQEVLLSTEDTKSLVTTNDTVQPAVEAKGAPMNNTVPETDSVGLKPLKSFHGAVAEVGTGVTENMKSRQIQMFVRFGIETIRFEVSEEEELRRKVERQWNIQAGQSLLHPKFDAQKSGAGYKPLPKCQHHFNFPETIKSTEYIETPMFGRTTLVMFS
jgi:hypothetical protein